jgi:5-methylcytosine-specific restriction endonuclease McrA
MRSRNEYLKQWRKDNPEKIRHYQKSADPAKKTLRRRLWNLSNPEKVRLHSKLKKARRRGATGKYTATAILEMLVRQQHRCANQSCRLSIRKRYDVDHILPLARGGTNDIANIQLLCPLCNTRKSAKDPFAWAREQGRLL